MQKHPKKAALIDPVCGMAVNQTTAKGQTAYEGKEIYFCSQECLQAFLSDPDKYHHPRKKGWWRRYMERLNKALAANPPQCRG